jgi:hypothetical protein
MAERIARQLVAEKAIVHEASTLRLPTPVDRSFEFSTGLYVAMVALFSLAIGVMAFGVAAPGLIIPTGIIAVFIAMIWGRRRGGSG